MTWTAQNPNFKYLSIQEKMQNLPEHLNYIIALADAKNLEIKKYGFMDQELVATPVKTLISIWPLMLEIQDIGVRL